MFDAIFAAANLYVLPFWALMILAPNWSWTRRICGSLLMFLPLALVYTVSLLLSLTGQGTAPSLALADLMTLKGIAALLGTTQGAAVGWVHFLTFDLFVGRWAYLDSRQRGIPSRWVSPALVFVFLAGPFGFLLYWIIRRQSGADKGTS